MAISEQVAKGLEVVFFNVTKNNSTIKMPYSVFGLSSNACQSSINIQQAMELILTANVDMVQTDCGWLVELA